MKKMKKFLSLLLAGALAFGSAGSHVYAANSAGDGTRPENGTTKEQPFANGTGTSSNFRIPCLVTLDDGTVVAGCDARWNWQMDGGGLDTIVSYSRNKGKTWNYTFANYLGDNGNAANYGSTAFIDPAMATDGETVYLVADLCPAGIALNGASYGPKNGHTGYDKDHNLVLAAATDSVNGTSDSAKRAAASFQYHLEKIEGAADNAASYYAIKDASGKTVNGYTVDAFFNIKGNQVDTNLFCGDSPYFPYPTDFLYLTKSEDGGATWSIPQLLDVKEASEQTLLAGPGRGIVTSTGRIIFTAYEHSSGYERTSCIYSDDQGKTWKRGEELGHSSSEAVVTPVGEKLYMFMRTNNGTNLYHISDDYGETWSEAYQMGISYNWRTQLSAITYSEKIDGKTAIIFSAPSNPNGRDSGKLYVGLVQEDGSLDWAYEYSVNGTESYAYSCLDECLDGTIALLYETNGGITYKNLMMEDIAAGASIGDEWITDAQGNAVTSVMMQAKNNAEAQCFTVHGAPAEAEVTMSKDGVVEASYANGTLTVTPVASVKGYQSVDVKVSGVTLHVEVTDADLSDEANFEKVKLALGETKTYTDESGNYTDAVDKSNLDEKIASVEVTGEDYQQPETPEQAAAQAKLATSVGNFDGKEISAADCLYTFTKADGENQYTVSAETAEKTTVYLAHRSGNNVPNKTTSAVITVAYDGEKGGFTLNDTSASSNGGYLFFWKDNAAKLHFDRNSTVDGNGRCHFELFKASETAENSPIKGYEKVEAVTSGEKYLIAAKTADGTYYVLHPFDDGSNYEHVAMIKNPAAVPETVQAQLGSDASYSGEKVSLKSCLYTFAAAGTENTYKISGTADGQKVYLSHQGAGGGVPQLETEANITLGYNAEKKAFTFLDGDRYLYFYKNDTTKLIFDKWRGSTPEEVFFELYTPSAEAAEASEIKGYQKVTALADVKADGQYLIAAKASDGNLYILHPSKSTTDKYSHVAKVTEEKIPVNGTTTITITGNAEGETSVKVGSKTYLISVKNKQKNLTLQVGEAVTVPGREYHTAEGQTAVALALNTDKPPYVQQTEIKSGEKYLLGRAGYVIVNRAGEEKPGNAPDGLAMDAVNLNSEEATEKMWTVTQKDGGYTLQAADGKYLSFNANAVVLSEAEQVLKIGKRANGGFSVSYNGQYLNDWAGSHNHVAGYGSDDNDWHFYAPMEGTIITGKTAGKTVDVQIGGITYHINVVCADDAHVWGQFAPVKEAGCTVRGTEKRSCEVCGEEEVRKVPALGHDFGDYVSDNNATCTEDGTETAKCKRKGCEETDTKVAEGSAKGHTWGEWKVVKEATFTETGLEERECSVCHEKETKTIPQLERPEKPFLDVEEGDYFYKPVLWALSNGITTGVGESGRFEPYTNSSRAHVVTFLYRAAGSPKVSADIKVPFTDVKETDYFYEALRWAYAEGIAKGYGDTDTFRPDESCTRAQMVTFIWRANGEQKSEKEVKFSDVAKDAYYYQAVQWAVENGITEGYGNTDTFKPDVTCTRAHAVTFLYRAAKEK